MQQFHKYYIANDLGNAYFFEKKLEITKAKKLFKPCVKLLGLNDEKKIPFNFSPQ